MSKKNNQVNNTSKLMDITCEKEIKDILNFSKQSSKEIIAHKLDLENIQETDNLNYITQSIYLSNK